jgi:hypothetical protein
MFHVEHFGGEIRSSRSHEFKDVDPLVLVQDQRLEFRIHSES